MADVAVFVLQVVAEICDVAESMKDNSKQASRLSERVQAVEPPVRAVHEGTRLYSAEALRQLWATLTDIRMYLEEYASANIVDWARKRKSYAKTFTQLNASLTEGMQALQLHVAVDAWANEDASDRRQDRNHLEAMMERMELRLTEDHAEVVGNQAKLGGALMDNHAGVMGNQEKAKLAMAGNHAEVVGNQAEILLALKVSLKSPRSQHVYVPLRLAAQPYQTS